MADKNIVIHPIINGEEDHSVNLFPKTKKKNILDFNVTVGDILSTSAQLGEVLTSDGNGGAKWEAISVPEYEFATNDDVDALFEEPAPAMVPFEVGQTISGYNFGNVNNGDTNADMDAFLAGLSYDGDDQCGLVSFSDGYLVVALNLSAFGGSGYALSVSDHDVPVFVYATEATTVMDISFTAGYQNLTNGVVLVGTPVTVSQVNTDVVGWNGVLLGAIEGQGPTPSDYFQLTNVELDRYEKEDHGNVDIYFYKEFAYPCQDASGTVIRSGDDGSLYKLAGTSVINGDTTFDDLTLEYVDDIEGENGWVDEREGSMILFDAIIDMDNMEITHKEGYGFIFYPGGANYQTVVFSALIENAQPTPTELTEFTEGQVISGIVLDPNAAPTGYSDMASYYDSFNDSETVFEISNGMSVFINKSAGMINVIPKSDLDMLCWVTDATAKQMGYDAGGWAHVVDQSEITMLTERFEYTFPEGVQTVGNDSIKQGFAPLNGTVLGAVEAQPQPTGLTPFEVGDDMTTIQLNTEMSDQEMTAFLNGLRATLGHEANVLFGDIGMSDPISVLSYLSDAEGDQPEDVISQLWFNDNILLYSTVAPWESAEVAGWQPSSTVDLGGGAQLVWNRDTKQLSVTGASITFTSATNGLNGVLFGKVEQPQPPQLTPLVVDGATTYSEITINPASVVKDEQTLDAWLAETIAIGLIDGLVASLADESLLILAADPSGGTPLLVFEDRGGQSESYIVYVGHDSFSSEGITKGWYTATSMDDLSTFTAITNMISMQLATSGYVSVEEGADTAFGKINGYIIGALQY